MLSCVYFGNASLVEKTRCLFFSVPSKLRTLKKTFLNLKKYIYIQINGATIRGLHSDIRSS